MRITPEPQRPPASARPGALLLVLCAAAFMSSLDVFIVNVALRDIGASVGGTSLADLSWVLNGYAIVFAALLVPAGRLADRYGTKRGFLFGLATFSLASLGCGLAGDLWLLVGLRAVQAVGAAALVPTSLGLILTAMPADRRAASVRLWAVAGSLGAAAGPVVGGLLVQLSWRWIFVLNVPVGLAAFVAAVVLAPDLRAGRGAPLPDLLGGGLLIVAIGALALSLVRGPDLGWASATTLGGFVVAAAAMGAFVRRSSRHPSPVVDPALLRAPTFVWANTAMVLFSVAFGVQLLGMVLWLQEGWGWTALRTGLAIAPGPMMVTAVALLLRGWVARFRAGVVAAAGIVLMGLGGVDVGVSVQAHQHYLTAVLPGWALVGTGVGFALPTLVAAATASLPPHQSATGSAVVQMGRQIGLVLGVALLVIVLGSAAADAGAVARFRTGWLVAGGFTLLAAAASLRMAALAPAPAVASAAPGGPADPALEVAVH